MQLRLLRIRPNFPTRAPMRPQSKNAFPTPCFLCVAQCIQQIMTVVGTADRSSGLGHIPAATTATLTRDWLLSVFALLACCRQLARVRTGAPECVKRPVSSSLLHRFFLPAERDQDSSLTSLLALPRHQLKRLLVHLHPPRVLDLQAPIVVLPPQDVLQSKINPKSPPSFCLAPHLILAWT